MRRGALKLMMMHDVTGRPVKRAWHRVSWTLLPASQRHLSAPLVGNVIPIMDLLLSIFLSSTTNDVFLYSLPAFPHLPSPSLPK